MKFTLEIELGNDAMSTPADVREALSEYFKQIQHVSSSHYIWSA